MKLPGNSIIQKCQSSIEKWISRGCGWELSMFFDIWIGLAMSMWSYESTLEELWTDENSNIHTTFQRGVSWKLPGNRVSRRSTDHRVKNELFGGLGWQFQFCFWIVNYWNLVYVVLNQHLSNYEPIQIQIDTHHFHGAFHEFARKSYQCDSFRGTNHRTKNGLFGAGVGIHIFFELRINGTMCTMWARINNFIKLWADSNPNIHTSFQQAVS